MVVDSARQYLDAKNKLDSAEFAVTNLMSFIGGVADAMRNDRWSFSVSNVDVPISIEARGGYILNADDWPSALKIAETFAALHEARHEAINAWSRLLLIDQSNLPPPPGAK